LGSFNINVKKGHNFFLRKVKPAFRLVYIKASQTKSVCVRIVRFAWTAA